jgi:hypothetical protein
MRRMTAGIVGLAATGLMCAAAFAADVTVRDLTLRLHHADRARPLQLSGLDLRELDLSGLDFKGASLTNSNLFGADLTRADLSKADLRGARLDRVVIIPSGDHRSALRRRRSFRHELPAPVEFLDAHCAGGRGAELCRH